MLRLLTTIAVLGWLSMCARVEGQSPSPESLSFSAASIKPAVPGTIRGSGPRVERPSGRFTMRNSPMRGAILFAHPVDGAEIVRAPDWVNRQRYDIDAVPPGPASQEQVRAMVRGMLADRLKLLVRKEVEIREVFAMVVARPGSLGSSLRRAENDCEAAQARAAETGKPMPLTLATNGAPLCVTMPLETGDGWRAGGVTMDFFAGYLSGQGRAGRRVVNKTGLPGSYEFTLQFSSPARALQNSGGAPVLFTALQEQLGLKLVDDRVQVEVLAIDRIEEPTEN